ncbi:MAG: hypothetical protein ACK4PH_25650, partial [Aquincola tertiaricarbonis]
QVVDSRAAATGVPAALSVGPPAQGDGVLELPPLPTGAAWDGRLFRAARWERRPAPGVLRSGRVAPACAADLWSMPHAPQLRLPVAHLENALRVAWPAGEAGATVPALLRIKRIELLAADAAAAADTVVQQADGRFIVADADHRPLLVIDGIGFAPVAATATAPQTLQAQHV